MKIQLSKNIRSYRKEQGYTQEQLAEALGVTVGAVSKWETGLSFPDIQLIVEMADFFRTSVDVLLGYEWREGSMGAVLSRIKEGKKNKEYEETAKEADKAIQRFPNSFDIIFQSGSLYLMMGLDTGNNEAMEKAVRLFKRSLELIEQNEDPEIDTFYIKQRIVNAYNMLGKVDEAIEILKETNINGINNGMLGYFLAVFKKDHDQSLKYLSKGLLDYVSNMIYTMFGYTNVFIETKQYQEAAAAMRVYINFLESIKKPNSVGALDKLQMISQLAIVDVYACEGNAEKVKEVLNQVYDKAISFGEKEDYSTKQIRFCFEDSPSVFSDFFGLDIMAGIEAYLKDAEKDMEREVKSEVLLQLWEDIKDERTKK